MVPNHLVKWPASPPLTWAALPPLPQSKRLSCMDALYHPFLEEGRIRYHTFLCSCCHTPSTGGGRKFCRDLEPGSPKKFDPGYERELSTIAKAKGIYYTALTGRQIIIMPMRGARGLVWKGRFLEKKNYVCFSFHSTSVPLYWQHKPPPSSTVYKRLLKAVQAVSKVIFISILDG